MLYNKILNPKYCRTLKALTFAVIAAFSLSLCSCYSVKTQNYSPDEYEASEKARDGQVLLIDTKDSIVFAENYDVRYVPKSSSVSSYFALEKIDSTPVKEYKQKAFRLYRSISELKMSDVQNIKVGHLYSDPVKTVMWTGIVLASIAALITAYFIAFPIKVNVFGSGSFL